MNTLEILRVTKDCDDWDKLICFAENCSWESRRRPSCRDDEERPFYRLGKCILRKTEWSNYRLLHISENRLLSRKQILTMDKLNVCR